MIKRTLHTIQLDVTVQLRNGFYYASGFFLIVWIGLLRPLPDDGTINYAMLVPIVASMNLLITTFYYVAGMVLLEKAQGTLDAIVTSPLRDGEYLAGKVLTLAGLAAVETMLLVVIVVGVGFNIALMLLGLLLLGAFLTLVGFVSVARYNGINEYMIPSVGIIILLIVPVIQQAGFVNYFLFDLHPIQPMLVLISGAMNPISTGRLLYGLIGSMFWLTLSGYWAHWMFISVILQRAGKGA